MVHHKQKKVLSECCTHCKENIVVFDRFIEDPNIFVITLQKRIKINKSLLLDVNGHSQRFKLTGIVYFGEFHFTSLLFDSEFNMLYHDGIVTKSGLWSVGHISDLDDLYRYKDRNARLIIYKSV